LDLGDVPLPEAMVNDVCVKHIETYYKGLDIAGVRPVSMGGDHGITGPIIKAIAGPQANISGGRKAALLHFDAHTDSYDQLGHWLGSRRSAAHWASYTVAEGHIDPSKSVQIGIRGNAYTLDWRESSHRIGYRVISMDEFEELGIETTIETIRQRVGDSPLYITLDLDALDPSVAPAVSNMEPGYVGFMPSQVIKIMHGLRGLDIIGADIVCLIPTKDNPNNITSMTAMVLMFEQIALIADYIRTAGSSKTS
jgi:guanidinopropionase